MGQCCLLLQQRQPWARERPGVSRQDWSGPREMWGRWWDTAVPEFPPVSPHWQAAYRPEAEPERQEEEEVWRTKPVRGAMTLIWTQGKWGTTDPSQWFLKGFFNGTVLLFGWKAHQQVKAFDQSSRKPRVYTGQYILQIWKFIVSLFLKWKKLILTQRYFIIWHSLVQQPSQCIHSLIKETDSKQTSWQTTYLSLTELSAVNNSRAFNSSHPWLCLASQFVCSTSCLWKNCTTSSRAPSENMKYSTGWAQKHSRPN